MPVGPPNTRAQGTLRVAKGHVQYGRACPRDAGQLQQLMSLSRPGLLGKNYARKISGSGAYLQLNSAIK